LPGPRPIRTRPGRWRAWSPNAPRPRLRLRDRSAAELGLVSRQISTGYRTILWCMYRNVLAVALANNLARIAWSVLAGERR
jgi:hypothetical protein